MNQANPFDILGINRNSTKEDAKRAYREIALSCHPDKLTRVTDSCEKAEKINRFKEATIAYNTIVNEEHIFSEGNDDLDWGQLWKTFFNNKEDTGEILKDVFLDVASVFMKGNIKPKAFYHPSQSLSVTSHEISVDISYSEIMNNKRKRLRLILVDIEEPIFVDINCGNYPQVIKEYIDDDDNEHEITINMNIKKHKMYDYILRDCGKIDLITSMKLSVSEYIEGTTKKIKYIDETFLDVAVEPFQEDYLIVKGKGLKNGDIYVDIRIAPPKYTQWNCLESSDKSELIRILKTI